MLVPLNVNKLILQPDEHLAECDERLADVFRPKAKTCGRSHTTNL
jgi:hypothetical protein